ncbi:MAG: hypothetical protein ACOZCL_11370 [Bacillota bacterium]
MKIKTGLKATLFFTNFIRVLVYILQLMSGLAAFALSATTSAFVIHHVFPNPYVPIAAGIGLDLAKVTSIFMHRFSLDQRTSRKAISFIWRGTLISIAALFTCIAVSGMLLNKNQDVILKEKQELITAQHNSILAEEKERYLLFSQTIINEKEKERETGIGERYLQLDEELKELARTYESRVNQLNEEYYLKLAALSNETFEGDRRMNDSLFENFRQTINRNFNVSTTYAGWIMVLVIAIAVSLELTIYSVFDSLACNILPYVKTLQDQERAELDHRIELHRNDMNYEKRADDIITTGVIEEMEEAKNARIVTEKLDNFALRAKKEMEKEIEKTKKSLNKNMLESMKEFLADDSDKDSA